VRDNLIVDFVPTDDPAATRIGLANPYHAASRDFVLVREA
jgi:hypothetical protein